MSYGTPQTLARRPVPVGSPNRPDADPAEDAYAAAMRDLARRERRRGAVPPSPSGKGSVAEAPPAPRSPDTRLLQLLADGPRQRSHLTAYWNGVARVTRLLADGLIAEVASPTECHRHRTVLVLTPAGRARLEAL